MKEDILRKTLVIVVTFLLFSVFLAPTLLQAGPAYPERAIKIIVPFKPGGASDFSARIIADYLSKRFGQPVVVQNIAGAGGTVGRRATVKSKPDGYTLVWDTQGFIVSYLTGIADFNWDDCTPICSGLKLAFMLVVKADAPWKTFKELVNDARKRPNEIKYVTGLGSTSHFSTLKVANALNAKFRIVGGGGAAVQMRQVLGGHADLCATALPSLLPYVQAGKLRALAVLTEKRVPVADVPTAKEQGFDVDFSIDYMMFGPKGIPQVVVETISDGIRDMIGDAKIMEKFTKVGWVPSYLDQKGMIALLQEANKTYLEIGKQAGVVKVGK